MSLVVSKIKNSLARCSFIFFFQSSFMILMLNMEGNYANQDVEKQENDFSGRRISNASTESHVFLTLEQYRVLVGIPQESARPLTTADNSALPKLNGNAIPPIAPHVTHRSTIESASRSMPRILIFLGLFARPVRKGSASDHNCDEVNEYPTSLYYTLKQEETDQWSQYHFYNFITYTCLVLQLVIASALIVIGAIPNQGEGSNGHRIAIAILGAVTGLLTGVLSLLKGQGLPNRFLQYASRLREVRTEIEFKDRILRSGAAQVTYRDVLDIVDRYEGVLDERDMNRPDTWTTQASRSPRKDSKTSIY